MSTNSLIGVKETTKATSAWWQMEECETHMSGTKEPHRNKKKNAWKANELITESINQ